MTTQYTHAVILAVPESMIPQANHLALLLGESAAKTNGSHTEINSDRWQISDKYGKIRETNTWEQ